MLLRMLATSPTGVRCILRGRHSFVYSFSPYLTDIFLSRYNALDLVTEENVSVVNHIRPSLKKSFNLAAYVNVCETLQQLLKLGVDLSKIDRHHQLASYLVKANFEKDIQPYVLFLLRNAGVKIADVPAVINRNPHLLMVSLDLEVLRFYFSNSLFLITRRPSKTSKCASTTFASASSASLRLPPCSSEPLTSSAWTRRHLTPVSGTSFASTPSRTFNFEAS